MTTPQLSQGTVVDGQYTVGQPVRTGVGTATYEATDRTGNQVHLTAYSQDCFPSALVLERSLREMRQLQAVQVPQMLRVLGCGKLDGGGAYEVNAAVSAPTLAERLQAQGRGLPPEEAAAVVAQVGEALLAAQKVGVIHRNLGAHVILSDEGSLRVSRFAVGEPCGGPSFGPLQTIAPEQVQGRVVDQRSLIYNLAALMHQLLTGKPLFEGDTAAVLRKHVSTEPPDTVHPALRRALGKDPRMRPMMLKQFLGELAVIGGAAAPGDAQPGGAPPRAGAKAAPTTRGWTMFMDAADAGTAQKPAPSPAAAAQSTPAAAPAPTPTPTPAAPAKPETPAAPTTRGWTMFMDANDAGGEQKPAAAPAPAPTAPASPQAKAPAAPTTPSSPAPTPAQPAAPSTRGWTMFVDSEDVGAAQPPAQAPAQPAPVPAATQKPTQPAAPTTPVAEPDERKPSTRGWTMFMDGDEPAAAPAKPEPAAPAPAARVEPAKPQAAAPAPATPPAPATGPSTRGWTMFVDSEDAAATPVKPGTAAPAPGAPAASAAPAVPSAPVRPEAPAAPVAAQPAPGAGESSAGGVQSRGWTMFMDAPLPGGGQRPAPAPEQPPVGPPVHEAVDGSSDAKGWTVFMDGAAPPPSAAQPQAAPPTGAPPTGAPPAQAAPSPGAAQAEPRAGTGPVVTGRTVFASTPDAPKSDAGMPDTMYFKRGETEPERAGPAARRPQTMNESIQAPATRAAAEERRAPVSTPAVQPGRDAPVAMAPIKSSNTTVIVVVVAAAVAAGVAALLFLL